MSLKIGFTYDAKEEYPLAEGETADIIAEFDPEPTLQEIFGALSTSGNEIVRIGHARSLINALSVKNERYDLVFNIAEGITGRGREGQVPSILELFNQPYSGADPVTMGLTLDKILAKKIVASDGVITPRWQKISSMNQLNEFSLSFPVFVKPSFEGTSKGITQDSLVRKKEDLFAQVERILTLYQQPALVEEFIVGSEFTIVVLGNGNARAFPPVQIIISGQRDLGEEFYTTERVYNSEISYLCPDDLPPSLNAKLERMSLDAYHALGCRDFGRIDFRVDKDGNPYFLECNPLPNISKSDVFPLVAERAGITYDKIIVEILHHALKRYHISSPVTV